MNTALTSPSPSTLPTKSHYLFGILRGERKAHVWLLMVALSIAAAIYPTYMVFRWGLPIVSKLEQNVKRIVEEVIPEELTITIKDGHAGTNVTEPYYLTISQQTLTSFLPVEEQDKNAPIAKLRLLAIDTQGSAENFERYQSLALLTGSSLVYHDDSDIKIQSLRDTPDMAINREFITQKIAEINKNNKVIKFLTGMLYVSPAFILIGLFLYYLFEVLGGAFLIWIMNKVMQTGIPFGRLFKLAGLLYLFPALFLILVSYIPGLKIFYLWFYTALDVAVLSAAYVLLKNYKTMFHHE